MDSVGAVIGPLLAAPVLLAVGYRWLFVISLLRGLSAAAAVLLLVREAPRIRAAVPPCTARCEPRPPPRDRFDGS